MYVLFDKFHVLLGNSLIEYIGLMEGVMYFDNWFWTSVSSLGGPNHPPENMFSDIPTTVPLIHHFHPPSQ